MFFVERIKARFAEVNTVKHFTEFFKILYPTKTIKKKGNN